MALGPFGPLILFVLARVFIPCTALHLHNSPENVRLTEPTNWFWKKADSVLSRYRSFLGRTWLLWVLPMVLVLAWVAYKAYGQAAPAGEFGYTLH